MLAASAQPQPPHLLVNPQHPHPPLAGHQQLPAPRKPMAPVPEVEDTLSPAPPGRLKTLFNRRSHSARAAAPSSSPTSSSASLSPAPPPAVPLAITPPPPPPSTALSSLDHPSPPFVASTPDLALPPQQASSSSTRARLKSLFAESARPASQAVRAFGNGFPNANSLRGGRQHLSPSPTPPPRSVSMSKSKSADRPYSPPHSPASPTPPLPSSLQQSKASPHSQSHPHLLAQPLLNLPPPPTSPPPSPSPQTTPTVTCRIETLSPSPVHMSGPSIAGPSRRSSPRVSVVTPPNPRDSSSTINGGASNGNSLRRNLGRSLLKGSLSSPSLTSKDKKESIPTLRKAKDDTDTRKKGRHSLAVLFQGRGRAIVTRETTPPRDAARSPPPPHKDFKDSSLPRASPLHFMGWASPQEASSTTSLGTPRAVSRAASLTALRSVSRQPSKSALKTDEQLQPALRLKPKDTPYTGHSIYGNRAHSSSSVSPVSPNGMSLSSSSVQRSRTSITGSSQNASHTSLSLSQTSLVLPEPSSRGQLLPKDHYHLRFASSYIINLITPTLRTVHFSRSERNMDLKRITEERLALLARMERTWGTSWADAASDLLNGSASTLSLELKAAKLRACNITATAKARERNVFVAAMRDGILFCFLFNRLFPSQPASIQRVKVPKDDVRVAANITRFLTACREIGVGEGDMFTLEDLDEHSPVGLARVARTILILANMAPPVTAPRPSTSRSNLRSGTASPNAEASSSSAVQGSSSAPGSTSARSSKTPSRPESPRTYSATAVASRTILERPLRSSSSDLHARLQQEGASSTPSTIGTSSSSSVSKAASASAASSTTPTATTATSATVSALPVSSASPTTPTPTPTVESSTKPSQPSRLSHSSYSATPPLSPVRSVGLPSTPRTSGSQTHHTPPTARPQRIATSKTQVSFKSDGSSPHASGHDWSSSFSSNHSTTHLSPLHERERTPSLVSTSSQVASSYSRSSIRGSVPTILNEDPHLEDEFDHLETAHIESTIETTTPSSLSEGRRLSEKTLQEARRKIIGTLLSSTDDLHRPSLEEARGFALSQSLAALEGSRPPLGKSRTDSPRIRPVTRRTRSQSAETSNNSTATSTLSKAESDTSPGTLTSELPPRPRIRRPSVNGKIYVPKRGSSPASSPNLSISAGPIISSPAMPLDSTTYMTGTLSKEDRRRSEDFPSRGLANNGANKIMNMRNHSMINLPATSRRTSGLSHASVDSTVTPSLQILRFSTADQPAVRYQLGNCIGRGQFGSVYRSLNLSTGQMVAIKRIRLSGMKETEVRDVMREVELLQRLTHPGIVKYEGMSRDDAFLNIVLEFVENGSLGQTLKAFGHFNERLVASYVAKILEGLNYLHSEGVVHCDLKAANILSTKNGNIKLSDFGVSLNMRAVEHFAERTSIGRATDPMKTNDVAGTPNWMAPEVIKLQGATPKSDIWSLGCTIVELLTGKPPYSDVGNSMTVLFRIVEDPLPPLPESSPELKDFLTLCFAKKPEDRPSAALLFEHEWVKAGHPDLLQRPQDSLPFLRRLSQEPNRMDSQRIFDPSAARSASASLIDLHQTTRDSEAVETRRHAQLSMVSLHSHLHLSREGLESTAAKAHDLVKTTFAKSITCHVCLEGVKKAAYLCQNCGLITHAKCAPRAKAGCDIRGQLALLASQQEWGVSEASSRANSPQPESPVLSLGSRLFGRNKSKSSLLAAPSTTSLVTPEPTACRRRHSSGAASSSRPFLDPANIPDTAGSFNSRHSETSEDNGGSLPRGDRNTSLIRIDEDGPANPPRFVRHVSGPPAVKVHGPVEGGISGPRRHTSMNLRPLRKDRKDDKGRDKGKGKDKEKEDNLRTECVIQ